jgi:hypothetical protein
MTMNDEIESTTATTQQQRGGGGYVRSENDAVFDKGFNHSNTLLLIQALTVDESSSNQQEHQHWNLASTLDSQIIPFITTIHGSHQDTELPLLQNPKHHRH